VSSVKSPSNCGNIVQLISFRAIKYVSQNCLSSPRFTPKSPKGDPFYRLKNLGVNKRNYFLLAFHFD